jgi:hypothetical protein
VVTTVTTYHWHFDAEWEVEAYCGTGAERVVLTKGSGTADLETTTDQSPKPTTLVCPPKDVNITELLKHIDGEGRLAFAIDRTQPKCHTPRRNEQVVVVLRFQVAFHAWAFQVRDYFLGLFRVSSTAGLDMGALTSSSIFNPVLPCTHTLTRMHICTRTHTNTPIHTSASTRIHKFTDTHTHEHTVFEKTAAVAAAIPGQGQGGDLVPLGVGAPAGSRCLALSDALLFLSEQRRTLADTSTKLDTSFPSPTALMSAGATKVVVGCLHAMDLAQSLADGFDHLEDMLRKQLVLAIGKVELYQPC